MTPENRPSRELLEGAHRIGVRTLGIPEEFGGTPVDPAAEVQTFAVVAEEISRFKIVKSMFPQSAGVYTGPEK